MNYRRNTQKRKGGSLNKDRVFSSKEIIDRIKILINRYVHSTGSTLKPVVFNNDSKIPFSEIIHMIKNCEDLETPYLIKDKTYYVFSFLVKQYIIDYKFLNTTVLTQHKISKSDINKYNIQYLQVIIECIREYLTNAKYKDPHHHHHHNNKHFYETIQNICKTGTNIIKSVFHLLTQLRDPLSENPEFLALCIEIIPTNAEYAGIPIGVKTKHSYRFFTSASEYATEAPRDLTPVRAKPVPIYVDEHTGEEIYDIPTSWSPNRDLRERLPKRPRSRSRSRGGKRKTKKSTK
jgi:hypothetical protein